MPSKNSINRPKQLANNANLLSSKSLSTKRAQKISRNIKYIEKRKYLKDQLKLEKNNGNPNVNTFSTDISVLPSTKVKDNSLKPVEAVKSYINEVITKNKQQSFNSGFIGTQGTLLGKATF